MARGGPRQNAGRKPGLKNSKTSQLEQIASAVLERNDAGGLVMPLDVMLQVMRHIHDSEEGALIHKGDVISKLDAMLLAVDVASKAAPYVHSRLGPVEANKESDSVADVLREIAKKLPT